MAKINPAKIFESLPHVNELWLTEDGHYHLHPHNGGEKVIRNEEENETEGKADAGEAADEINPVKTEGKADAGNKNKSRR